MNLTMSPSCDERIIVWAEEQFSFKIPAKELHGLLRSKHATHLSKLLDYLSQHVKSKRTSKNIKMNYEHINCSKQVEEHVQEVANLATSLAHLKRVSESKCKMNAIALKKEEMIHDYDMAKSVCNVLEEMSLEINHKVCNDEVALQALGKTISCYDSLFQEGYKLIMKGENIPPVGEKIDDLDSDKLIRKIREVSVKIQNALADLNGFDLGNVSDFVFDPKEMVEILVRREEDEENTTHEKPKVGLIESELNEELKRVVEKLSEQYSQIRSKQIKKLKDKLVNAIAKCDDAIHQKRLKCL